MSYITNDQTNQLFEQLPAITPASQHHLEPSLAGAYVVSLKFLDAHLLS